MTAEKIKTIDGQKLLEMELPPIRFIIDELLPQGFYILAGSPKIGKSWLLLLLCLQVAKGEPFWNRSTEKGTVLYLCLEDSPSRIQHCALSLFGGQSEQDTAEIVRTHRGRSSEPEICHIRKLTFKRTCRANGNVHSGKSRYKSDSH